MEVKSTRLSNGMTVVTDRMPHLKTAALGIWVRTGSRSEKPDQNGITHLLEHMAFKGTATRSARDIAEEIEAVGGELNASTSIEHTNYYARVLAENVPLAVEMLADILQNSSFDALELKREQHVILQEIGAAHDSPEDQAFDLFQETAWPDQAIGRPILGTPETVKGFTSPALHTYLADRYRGPDLVLSAAGLVDHEALVQLAEEKFKKIQPEPAVPDDTARYVGGERRIVKDLMEAQVLLGFEGRPYRSKDYYAIQILASVLGGGMSSRLFQEIRENRGLCYAIYSFHWAFSDTGLFGLHAATSEEDLGQLMPVILDELANAGNTISDEEVARSRAQIRAGLMMALESPTARAGQIARQILVHGRVLTMDEVSRKINDVTVADIRRVAHETFLESTPTLTAVGPVQNIMPVVDITERLNTPQLRRAAL
ncbi:putative Zn-dependent peptidase [Roseibium hamelinense]|uniref:Putative Zn-dependent peptidase n=1 Tax=Roseibium hamelinense TaxID=150831 RepID=A0A562T3M2_9HYPH|nr:pitrilysin family protein [Roseibium hamelinense]MTI42938.1 insulinase family protein [Roseibium hamelinense]TWI87626.1 putative Zn-dependent peptidase [Roseibium hamelinense]